MKIGNENKSNNLQYFAFISMNSKLKQNNILYKSTYFKIILYLFII
jgi:hypothetical protein